MKSRDDIYKALAACWTPSRCWINGSHMKLSKSDYIYLCITKTSRELEHSLCTMFLVTYVYYLFKFLQPYKVGIFFKRNRNVEITIFNQEHTTNEWQSKSQDVIPKPSSFHLNTLLLVNSIKPSSLRTRERRWKTIAPNTVGNQREAICNKLWRLNTCILLRVCMLLVYEMTKILNNFWWRMCLNLFQNDLLPRHSESFSLCCPWITFMKWLAMTWRTVCNYRLLAGW